MDHSLTHLTAEFSAATEAHEDLVLYEGKVFEAGEYPDKAFAIDEAELTDKVQAFTGVDLDLEHSQFKDLLGNKLGRLEALWNRGTEAMGRLRIPRWLHELTGGRLQTSLSFDQEKNIVGCALTLSPRIPDAQVVAAFTRAQAPPTPQTKEIKSMPISLKDRLRVLFGSAPDATQQAGIDPHELDQIEFNFAPPELDPTIQAQLAEFKATNERLIAGQLNVSATLFADEVIQAAKAVPAQREHLIALFRTAALADGKGTVRFSEAGQIAEGTNLQALRDLFKDAQPHHLFRTQIPNEDPNANGGEPSPKVMDQLRRATSLGQQTLTKENA